MARTTEANVQGIIKTNASISLTPFIETANALVTAKCADQEDSDYDDTHLELIERWLAAHFYAVRHLRAASEKAGSVAESKQFKVDLNLSVTIYGQQAMIVDYEGYLANLNKKVASGGRRRVGIWHLGTTDSDGNDITGE